MEDDGCNHKIIMRFRIEKVTVGRGNTVLTSGAYNPISSQNKHFYKCFAILEKHLSPKLYFVCLCVISSARFTTIGLPSNNTQCVMPVIYVY